MHWSFGAMVARSSPIRLPVRFDVHHHDWKGKAKVEGSSPLRIALLWFHMWFHIFVNCITFFFDIIVLLVVIDKKIFKFCYFVFDHGRLSARYVMHLRKGKHQ